MAELMWDFDKQKPIAGGPHRNPIKNPAVTDKRCLLCLTPTITFVFYTQPDDSEFSACTPKQFIEAGFHEDSDIQFLGYSCPPCYEEVRNLIR